MDQEVTGWGRSWSSGVCSSALPVPLLVTVTVNPMASPAETEALSADLATSMAAPRTSTDRKSVVEGKRVEVRWGGMFKGEKLAVAAVWGEEECRVEEAPPARSEGPQLRVPPAMAQVV